MGGGDVGQPGMRRQCLRGRHVQAMRIHRRGHHSRAGWRVFHPYRVARVQQQPRADIQPLLGAGDDQDLFRLADDFCA